MTDLATEIRGLAKKTAEMNAEFDAADNAGKRVIIAQDVVAALTAKSIVPRHGHYLYLPPTLGEKYDHREFERRVGGRTEESLQEILPTLPPCHVCAKGALFVCTVARRNQVTAGAALEGGSFDAQKLAPLLGGLFGRDQLALIEAEFEAEMIDSQGGYQDDYAPVMFADEDELTAEDRTSPRDRMIAIMKNIIDNGGTFCPEAAK